MPTVVEFWRNCNPAPGGVFRFNEPMADHTSFRAGGKADLWLRPDGAAWDGLWTEGPLGRLLAQARREGIPLFILGGGANLLVSDGGIRGIVLDTGGNAGRMDPPEDHLQEDCPPGDLPPEDPAGGGGTTLWFRSGTTLDEAAEEAARRGLSGLEFFAGMPGSVGGALWMNARCYGRETADTAVKAALYVPGGTDGPGGPGGPGEPGRPHIVPLDRKEFGYKKSPFQEGDKLILAAAFALHGRDPALIRREMEEHRKDREARGHYRFPSAGSVFKNNRDFGKPSGQIIDELGLKGLSIGAAQVAPWHGNIIINRGGARAADIRSLMESVRDRVREALGINLEPEIRLAGDWSNSS